MATNRNGHKPERPQTETATNRNDHRPKRPKTKTATNWKGHTRWYPNILQGTCMASGLQNTSVNNVWMLIVYSEMWMVITVTGHNGHKLKRPQPKRPQTGTATTETATNRNGHKPKRPQTGTATNRNGHRPKRPQTETTTQNDIPIYCKAHVWPLGYRIRL